MRPSWGRRNAVALGALAVVLPATFAVVGGYEGWSMNQSRPVFPTVVPMNQTTSFADAEWGPAEATLSTPPVGEELPADARIVTVEVPVTPQDGPVACAIPDLREIGGAERQWEFSSEQTPYDGITVTICPSEGAAPFTLKVAYVVPADATGPFGVDVAVSEALPGFLRLVVEP